MWSEMAKESGVDQYVAPSNKFLMRFAEAVRAQAIRECAALCDQRQRYWELQSQDSDFPYDWKAEGAGECAEKLRALLEQDV